MVQRGQELSFALEPSAVSRAGLELDAKGHLAFENRVSDHEQSTMR